MRSQLISVARRIVRDGGEAEDVADEAIARLVAEQRDGRTIDSVPAWLHRITLRLAVDRARAWVRRQRPEWQHDVARRPASPDPAAALESTEMRERVWLAILALPDRPRDALILRQMEGLDYAQVAAHLGVSEATARTHVHTARLRLREAIWGRTEDGENP